MALATTMIVLSTSSLARAKAPLTMSTRFERAVSPLPELLRAIQGKKGAVSTRRLDQIIRSAVASGGARKVSLSGNRTGQRDFPTCRRTTHWIGPAQL